MSNQTLQFIQPIINIVVVAVLSYMGAQLKKLVPPTVDYLIAKMGLAKYQKTKAVAIDVWNKIEEGFRLNELAGSKYSLFVNMLKDKVPGITDDEVMFFNKAVAGEVNKDKPFIEATIDNTINATSISTADAPATTVSDAPTDLNTKVNTSIAIDSGTVSQADNVIDGNVASANNVADTKQQSL